MKYLIEWILKGILLLIAIDIAGVILCLLALIMWNIKFLDLAEEMIRLIIHGNKE